MQMDSYEQAGVDIYAIIDVQKDMNLLIGR